MSKILDSKRRELIKIIKSPIGKIKISATDSELISLSWHAVSNKLINQSNKVLEEAEGQLKQYFSGERRSFDLPINLNGTRFEKMVWRELLKIPFGKTNSYKDIAVIIKSPNSFRAVGNAVGKNPLGIIVPCHRIIKSDGSIGGFAGGINRKKILLDLESNNNQKSL